MNTLAAKAKGKLMTQTLPDYVKWLLGLISAFILMGVGFAAKSAWTHELRIASIEKEMVTISKEIQSSSKDAATALQVVAQHGDEFLLLRKTQDQLMAQITATTQLLSDQITSATQNYVPRREYQDELLELKDALNHIKEHLEQESH